jgi:hypothetical protein
LNRYAISAGPFIFYTERNGTGNLFKRYVITRSGAGNLLNRYALYIADRKERIQNIRY